MTARNRDLPPEMHKLLHGLYLSIGDTEDGQLIAICSDGTPTQGHVPVTVLDVEIVQSHQQATDWFNKFQKNYCVSAY